MKRFHWAICSLIAMSFGICSLLYQTKLNNRREIEAAYERGVRWGERERKFLVVLDGVTNKFDSMAEAVSNAPVGAEVYIPLGTHDLGTNSFSLPSRVALNATTGGMTTVIGGAFYATNDWEKP